MADKLRLKIITPDSLVFDGEVEEVSAFFPVTFLSCPPFFQGGCGSEPKDLARPFL